MQYFKQKLLNYSTQKQISTLLHIHTEIDKPKGVGVPSIRSQNYVDHILNQYSVKMYTYPDLTQADNRMAFGIYGQKKIGGNVFVFEEFKRKPLKKKVIRKPILPLLPQQIPQKVERICPCCQAKFAIKHKCEHTICQKPCNRMKRHKAFISQQPNPNGKKLIDQEYQLSPEKSELEIEQSKSSNMDQQSDYSQQAEIMAGGSDDSDSFQSTLSKNKKGKGRGVRSRKQGNRNRRSRRTMKNVTPSRRSSRRQMLNNLKDQQNNQQVDQQRNDQTENLEQKNNVQNQEQVKEREVFRELPPPRRKKQIKKPEPKAPASQNNNNAESQFEPKTIGSKDLKKKRSSNQKKANFENEDKDSGSDNLKFRKKQPLSYFCTPQQLNTNQIYNIRIIDDRVQPKKDEQIPQQNFDPIQEKKPAEVKSVQMQANQKQEEVQQAQEPMVDAIFDPVSEDNSNDNQVPLFQNDENNENNENNQNNEIIGNNQRNENIENDGNYQNNQDIQNDERVENIENEYENQNQNENEEN